MNASIARRQILKQGGALGLGLVAAATAQAAAAIGLTPAQPEGPFYPVADQADKDTDLTRVAGRPATAQGQVVHLSGRVTGVDGAPLAGALVEIWQACATGKYNHPDDPNEAALDENFQYWGRTTTDAQGRYGFKTIKPGAYPADAGWVRPPHIHFRIAAPGFPSLTTQLYFAGDALNATDRILRALPPEQRKLLTVAFSPTTGGAIHGQFDVIVGRRGALGVTPEVEWTQFLRRGSAKLGGRCLVELVELLAGFAGVGGEVS